MKRHAVKCAPPAYGSLWSYTMKTIRMTGKGGLGTEHQFFDSYADVWRTAHAGKAIEMSDGCASWLIATYPQDFEYVGEKPKPMAPKPSPQPAPPKPRERAARPRRMKPFGGRDK